MLVSRVVDVVRDRTLVWRAVKTSRANQRRIEPPHYVTAVARRQESGKTKMLFEAALEGLQARIAVLESVIELFSDLLPAPKLFVSETVRGFRYENPDVRHFCLLKAARTVSALNASLELARKGYTQEIAALMRIVAECTRHIEYVLDIDRSAEHRSNVEKYLRDFF